MMLMNEHAQDSAALRKAVPEFAKLVYILLVCIVAWQACSLGA